MWPLVATGPSPVLMSQYSRPSGVLCGAPLTGVGALFEAGTLACVGVFSFAGDVVSAWRFELRIHKKPITITTITISKIYLYIFASGYFLNSAITSISTSTSLGRRATSTVERAGGFSVKCRP